MRINVLARRLHYWASFLTAAPVLLILSSGVLLQVKKEWSFVQPTECRGTGEVPEVGLEEILGAVQAEPSLGVSGWSDVDRVDLRPSKGLAKVLLANGVEAQVDLGTGRQSS